MKVFILIQNVYVEHDVNEDTILGVFITEKSAEQNKPKDASTRFEDISYRIEEYSVKTT
jgi:hypothetical protein